MFRIVTKNVQKQVDQIKNQKLKGQNNNALKMIFIKKDFKRSECQSTIMCDWCQIEMMN